MAEPKHPSRAAAFAHHMADEPMCEACADVIPHGTARGYQRYGCRCDACLVALADCAGELRARDRDRARDYYRANRDHINAQRQARHDANPDKRRSQGRANRAANLERDTVRIAAWAAVNADRRRATNAAWYVANHERRLAEARAYRAAHPEAARAQGTLAAARGRARVRGVPCTITLADVQEQFAASDACPVCGVVMVRGSRGAREPASWSLDCVDPRLGYVPGNILGMCWQCNRRKGPHSPQDLIKMASRIMAAVAGRTGARHVD